MPNLDQPCGFVPKGIPLRENKYIAGGVIYPGDCVKLDAAGKVVVAAATNPICGVANSYAAADGDSVTVWDHPDQLFVAQASAAEIDAQTDILQNYEILANAGSSTYRLSRHEVDSSTGSATATVVLKLLGVEEKVGTALGANAKCIVRINNHQLSAGTGTAGV